MPPSEQPTSTVADTTVEAAADQIAALLPSLEDSESESDESTQDTAAPEDGAAEDTQDEDTPDDSSPDDAPAAPVAIRTKDGTEWTAEDIEKGALRQADYTRKTQAVAEQRKAFEAEVEAVRGERARYAGQLSQLEQILVQQAPPMPDAALRQTDPAEYSARMTDHMRHQQDLATVAAQRQQVERQMAEDAATRHAQYVATERDRLLEAVPEWQDRDVAQTDLLALRAEGLERGFTDAELDTVADHRALLLLRDARRYREAQAATAKVQPKIAKAPMLKPGATGTVTPKPVLDSRKAMQRLKSSGKAEDAARIIAAQFLD